MDWIQPFTSKKANGWAMIEYPLWDEMRYVMTLVLTDERTF